MSKTKNKTPNHTTILEEASRTARREIGRGWKTLSQAQRGHYYGKAKSLLTKIPGELSYVPETSLGVLPSPNPKTTILADVQGEMTLHGEITITFQDANIAKLVRERQRELNQYAKSLIQERIDEEGAGATFAAMWSYER